MGDAEGLKLVGDAFSVVWLHADRWWETQDLMTQDWRAWEVLRAGHARVPSLAKLRAMPWAGMFHPVGVESTIHDSHHGAAGPGPGLPPISGMTFRMWSSSTAFASRN